MKSARSSARSVHFDQTTRRHFLENIHLPDIARIVHDRNSNCNSIYMDVWLQMVKHMAKCAFNGSTIKRQTAMKRGHLSEAIKSHFVAWHMVR
jgi:hypothetical protein